MDIPDALSGESDTTLAERARLLLVVEEVRAGRLTRGRAARALGMTLDDFLIATGRHGLYAIEYDLDDFRRELDELAPSAAASRPPSQGEVMPSDEEDGGLIEGLASIHAGRVVDADQARRKLQERQQK